MTSTSCESFPILPTPLFTRKNYEYQSLIMNALFQFQYVWEIVENGYVEPRYQLAYNSLTKVQKDALRDKRKKYGKSLFYIHKVMHKNRPLRVEIVQQYKDAWDTLKTSYQGIAKVKIAKLQILRRYFQNMSMKYLDVIGYFYTHSIGLINQFKSHGETIEDRKVVEKVPRILPHKFDHIVVTLEETKDLNQFRND